MQLPDNRLSDSYHLVLSRRMTTWVLLVYSFLFIGILIGYSVAWLNAHKSFLPYDLPLTALELYFCAGMIIFVGFTVFSLIFQPQVMDLQLKLYNATGKAHLDDKLMQLQVFADIQRENGNLGRRVKLFLSDEVQMNALTYGGFLKEARVVFASDMFEAFSGRELQGILCHELAHVHYGDYYISIAFHYLLRLLDMLLKPFRWVSGIIDFIMNLLAGVPYLGNFIRLIGYLIKLAVGIVVAPFWLVRALHSLDQQMREYISDDYAVRISDDADGILAALMKLENAQIEFFDPEPEQHKTAVAGNDKENKESGSNDGKSGRTAARKKKPVISGKYRRYATLVYEVAQQEPETLVQRLFALINRLDDTHPPGELRWKRIARVGFQIEAVRNRREINLYEAT